MISGELVTKILTVGYFREVAWYLFSF